MASKASIGLVLGTAQLGMAYGIANRTGQPDLARATEIVRIAWAGGIREFDTAQDYGASEAVLGKVFSALNIAGEARVISKIDPEIDPLNPQAMAGALDRSLKRLGIPRLSGLMLHKEGLLSQWSRGMGRILQGFVAEGKVSRIGVSVYSPDKALEALDIEGVDMVQVPSNILDRRFERKSVFERASQKKKRIYVRSVFLQGLILMDPDALPGHMLFARPILEKIISLARELNVTRCELAVSYLKERIPGAGLLIGAETAEQVEENLAAWAKKSAANLMPSVLKCFDQVGEKILNPALWGSVQ